LRAKNFINTSLFFLLISFFSNNAWSENSTKNRFRSCTPEAGVVGSENPHPEGLEFNPTGFGDDFMYELDNPICAAVVLPPYAIVKLAIADMNAICGTGSWIPRPIPSPILDTRDVAMASKKASGNPACRNAVIRSLITLSGMIASVSFQYLNAKDSFENTRLCGGGIDNEENWMRWNSQSMSREIPYKKRKVEEKIKGWIENCKENPDSNDCNLLEEGLLNANYRQWYYGGVEKEDTGDGACPDVTRRFGDWEDDSNKVNYNDEIYPAQRYYMRGTKAGNYACNRYNIRFVKDDPFTEGPLSASRVDDYKHAYQCCLERSKTTVCIERKYCKTGLYVDACPGDEIGNNTAIEHKFCKGGSRCSVGPTAPKATFNADYEDDQRLICVSSYNMCPYNFNVSGGSTQCDMFKDGKTNGGVFTPVSPEAIESQECQGKSEIRDDDCTINSKAGKCKNYCQYLNHCVVVGGNDYIYNTSISSPYFSKACMDFIGDSKNDYNYGRGYNSGMFAGTLRHFTAPIAQCVKETLENIFYNNAGHTQCGNIDEYPDKNGKCYSNFYQYKKGENVEGQLSFFSFFQDSIRTAIKIGITIAVMIFGIKILLGGQIPKPPEIIMFVVKISLVMYFALGTAWQTMFFDGVYRVSSTFSTIVMNVKTSVNEEQRDGCQFGKVTLPDGSKQAVSSYSDGKEYLAVWDTLDCKIAKYLGFSPSFTVANIAKLILGSFFTGMLGVYFALMLLSFAYFIIVAALTALHIFIASAFIIILLVFISPITITMSLFKRTESIFTRWMLQLIGASLQPILLFAYLGFFITIFDMVMVGSASFHGKPPQKTVVCDKICVDSDGNKVNTSSGGSEGSDSQINSCDLESGNKILDPMSDSVICMMNLQNDKFGEIPILEPLGIALPLIKNFFSEDGRQRILTMMKAALVIFILVRFMAEIPTMAVNIIGGESPPAGTMPFKNMTGKIKSGLKGMTERGRGASRKAGGAAKSTAQKAKDAIGEVSNKGNSGGSSG
jgi:type IV secretory pathway VirB6-like protein